METKALAKKGLDVLKKNNTTIMFGTGLITLGVGVFFLVKKTIESHDILANNYVATHVDEDGNETTVERTIMDTLKLIGKTYWIPGVMIVSGTGLLIASHVMQCSKSASAMMAAGMAATSLNEWKAKAEEVLGEKNMQKVTDAIAQEKAERLSDDDLTPPWEKAGGAEYDCIDDRDEIIVGTDIVPYDDKNTLVEDGLTGQKIWTNRETLNEVILKLGEWVNAGDDVTLNEYLDEIGGKRVVSGWGDAMGWKAYGNRPHARLSKAITIGGKQFVVIEHDVAPISLYER